MIRDTYQPISATQWARLANEAYARDDLAEHVEMPAEPSQRFAVITCMDTRIDPYRMLGLARGDAHILRNAGGIVTDDVLRSLVLSHHALGMQEVMIINHTHCGLLGLNDDEFVMQLKKTTGCAAKELENFHGFTDLRENIRRQVAKVRDCPWLEGLTKVSGYVLDVKTGKLERVPLDGASVPSSAS